MNFLIDYNLTGDAVLFWGTLSAEGWLDLLPIRFFTFQEVELPMDSSDRVVWDFAQTNQMILYLSRQAAIAGIRQQTTQHCVNDIDAD